MLTTILGCHKTGRNLRDCFEVTWRFTNAVTYVRLGSDARYFSNYPFFITQQDRDGATPLHYAALQGQERFVINGIFKSLRFKGKRLTHGLERRIILSLLCMTSCVSCRIPRFPVVSSLLFLMIDLIREEADESFDLCRLVDHDDANILHYAGVGGHFKTAQALVRDTALLTLGRSKTMEDPAETARANGHSKMYDRIGVEVYFGARAALFAMFRICGAVVELLWGVHNLIAAVYHCCVQL